MYALVTHKPLDVRVVNHTEMRHTKRNERLGLFFPSLIIGLCSNAGVVWEETEDLI